MAWNNAGDLVVASSGQVYVAPVGTALPTTTTGALNAAFVGLGFVTENGVKVTRTPEIQEFNAWQSKVAVRRENVLDTWQLAFELEQWDEDTVPFAFGGGSISGTTPNYHYALPDDTAALDERALVLEANDGTEHHRWVFSRGNVTEAVETTYARNALAVLPITYKVLAPTAGGAPGDYYTDSASFAAGS